MRDLKKLIVVDVEATCWENKPPPNNESEIIEIGVCSLSLDDFEISDRQSLVVCPQFSTVSEFCTRLTGWTQKEVDRGTTLDEAFKVLRKQYSSKNRIWASYGHYDQRITRTECERKNLQYPYGSFHLNVKAVIETICGRTMGLGEAVQEFGLEFEGVPHRGVDDAVNIARLYRSVLESCRLDLTGRSSAG